MKTIYVFILLAFHVNVIIAQAGWFVQTSGTSKELWGVCFTDGNTGTAVGESGTILRTTNGGDSWIAQSSGTPRFLYSVSFIDANTGTAVGYSGIIIRTTNGGQNWITQSNSGADLFGVHFTDTNTGTAVGRFGTILRTTDGGVNWFTQPSGTMSPLLDVFFINADTGSAVGMYGTILRTTNGGVNWFAQSYTYPSAYRGVYFTDGNRGTAVGDYGTIIRTTNGGQNWFGQFPGTGRSLYGVCFSDANTGTVVGEFGTILRTTNGGSSWSPQFGLWNDLFDVSFTGSDTGTVVGAGGRILRTIMGGLPVELSSFTASTIGNNIILTWVTATELNNYGFELFRNGNHITFVKGKGTTTEKQEYIYEDSNLKPSIYLYRLEQIDFDGTRTVSSELMVHLVLPEIFNLEQNYPNPFNPTTTIGWQTPIGCWQSLKIYDVLGNEVATLVDEYKSAGSYTYDWKPTGLTSGVYFYRLNAGNFVQTKKMLFLR